MQELIQMRLLPYLRRMQMGVPISTKLTKSVRVEPMGNRHARLEIGGAAARDGSGEARRLLTDPPTRSGPSKRRASPPSIGSLARSAGA